MIDGIEQESFPSVARETNRQEPCLFSVDAERAVLAAMLTSPEAALQLATLLTADEFYLAGHRALFAAMQALRTAGVAIDPITLVNQLEVQGQLKVAGGREAIGGLYDEIPTSDHAGSHATIVRQYAQRRHLRSLGMRIAREASDVAVPVDALRDQASRGLLAAVAGETERGFRPARDGVRQVLQRLQDIEAGTVTPGLLTGFPELDDLLDGGFAEGDLVLVVGVPSSGKTAFMSGVLRRLAVDKVGTTSLVSAEVTQEIVMRAQISDVGDVPTAHIKQGAFTGDEAARVVRAAGVISNAPFYIDDEPTPAVEDVIARCTLLKAKCPDLKAVGIDFLQMLQRRDRGRGELEELALEKTAYDLKAMAKRLGIVVFAAVQPNDKQIEAREDKRPEVSDIARSSGPRRAADVILLIYRAGQYSAGAAPTFEVKVGKQRTGRLGVAMLEWQGSFVRVLSPRLKKLAAEAAAAAKKPLELMP